MNTRQVNTTLSSKNSKKIEIMIAVFGPGEGRCRDCENLCCYMTAKKYYKCSVYGLSSSEATDWRVSFPACGMKNKEWDGNPIYKPVQKRRKPEEQIPGQMSFADLIS